MGRRRIFRPAPGPRRWGGLLLGCGAVAGILMLAVALPGNLLGSAPGEHVWQAGAAEIRVVDADTLRLGDRVLRLDGLVVPGRGTARCPVAAGGLDDCATAGAAALASLVLDEAVVCRVQGRDRHGRALATCRAGEVELNAALVAAGWARAETASLAVHEAEARQQGRGLWGPGAIWPEGWR